MLIGLLWATAHAAPAEALPRCTFPGDERALYLLTVQPLPGDVINLFGHTALVDWDPERGADSALYDYGRFQLPPSVVETVVNYLTMKQVYYLGTNPLKYTVGRYTHQQRGVVAQRLALTDAEASVLLRTVRRELSNEPEFRYNWYDNNCSTKVRDRIDEAIGGALKQQKQSPSGTSPANEVLRHSASHPLWFGLMWGSTRYARQEIADWDAMFLPEPLMARVADAKRPDGTPLVASTCQLVPDGQPPVRARAPTRWAALTALGLVLCAGLVQLTRRSRRAGLVATGIAGTLLGTFGTAALIVGLAGTFAPFWGHDNLAFASPLWFLAVAAAIGAGRAPDARWPAWIGAGLLGVAGLGVLGSMVFGFAAGNLGIAGLFVPIAAAVAYALGADRLLPPTSRPGAASRADAAG